MGEFKSKKIRVNGNRHEVAVVVNTENQNNVSRKKVGQKLVTRQNENPEHVARKAVPGFWISFPLDGGDGLFTGKHANRKNGSIQD